MKRIFIAVILLLLLPCCSEQVSMNTEIFSKRLVTKSELLPRSPQIYYDNGSGVFILNDERGNEAMIRTAINENGIIKGIRITVSTENEKDESKRLFFIELCENATEIFAFDEKDSINNIIEHLMLGEDSKKEIYRFSDSEWYRYSYIKNKIGADFCCESKRLDPDKSELTLAEKP